MFSFDLGNKTLMFATAFFAARGEPVLQVRWATEIKQGALVQANTVLGFVLFNDGSRLIMTNPAEASGVIAATNRRIVYEELGVAPGQFAFRLI